MKHQHNLLFLVLILLTSEHLNAQKYYNQWYFGMKGAIDFNNNPPSEIAGSKLYSYESSTSVCDPITGRILFYTDGDTIWNRLHQPMLNFEPLVNPQSRNSCVQGSMIVPHPSNGHLYYLILNPSMENYQQDTMISCWTIDMRGDGGLGAVVDKSKRLFRGGRECFALTLHANGRDYWVASTYNWGTENIFRCTRSINGNFNSPVQSQILHRDVVTIPGNNKFSPNSKIYAACTYAHLNPTRIYHSIHKFDNNSGRLSDEINILIPPNLSPRTAIEFSPDSRFLYLIRQDNSSPPISYLVQYDLSVWDSASINASATIINSQNYIIAMQIGPDGKIYCFDGISNYISVIERPNEKGTAASFRRIAIPLHNGRTYVGGPYYPTCPLRRQFLLEKDSLLCTGDSMVLYSRLAPGSSLIWSTGDTSLSIKVKTAGKYWFISDSISSDTVTIRYGKPFKVYLGRDTAFCRRFNILLKAGIGARSYDWNTGETTESISVNSKGEYMVKVTDSNACLSGDTIHIDEIKPPLVEIIPDSINCTGTILKVNKVDGLQYLWNTGDTSNSILAKQKGQYSIKASHRYCERIDTIRVDVLPWPRVNLGPDQLTCNFPVLLNSDGKGTHLWSTGENSQSIFVKTPGTYTLTVSRHNCKVTDSILIELCEDLLIFVPDVFTPNDDGLNDVFRVEGRNIQSLRLSIFNRWGEELISTEGSSASWDGTYQNKICPDGVYMFVIEAEGYVEGRYRVIHKSGTLTLMR